MNPTRVVVLQNRSEEVGNGMSPKVRRNVADAQAAVRVREVGEHYRCDGHPHRACSPVLVFCQEGSWGDVWVVIQKAQVSAMRNNVLGFLVDYILQALPRLN